MKSSAHLVVVRTGLESLDVAHDEAHVDGDRVELVADGALELIVLVRDLDGKKRAREGRERGIEKLLCGCEAGASPPAPPSAPPRQQQ